MSAACSGRRIQRTSMASVTFGVRWKKRKRKICSSIWEFKAFSFQIAEIKTKLRSKNLASFMAFSSRGIRKIKSLSYSHRIRSLSTSTQTKPCEDLTTDPRSLLYNSPDPKVFDHSALLFPRPRISTLPNGLRVITESSPTSAIHTATIGVWIDAGSRF